MTFLSRLCSYHGLEEMMSFILILGVVGAYNLLFALTRTSRIGWALTGLLSLAGMAGLIWLSARPVFPRRLASSRTGHRSEEHTSELQSLMRISYAVFCLQKKNNHTPII